MTGSQAANFYTGIVAELYGPLKAYTQRAEPYAQFIAATGEPALELGCGDGEPLLDLRRAGLDVDGVDSSQDMLDCCRLAAHRDHIEVALFCQRMEELHLERRYHSIFLAGPTINLLPNDDTTLQALQRIREHLVPDGQALIPIFTPPRLPPSGIGVTKEQTQGDTLARVTTVEYQRTEEARTLTTILRYEKHTPGESQSTERPWVLHWHSQQEFRALATRAGLLTVAVELADGSRAPEEATDVSFRLSCG